MAVAGCWVRARIVSGQELGVGQKHGDGQELASGQELDDWWELGGRIRACSYLHKTKESNMICKFPESLMSQTAARSRASPPVAFLSLNLKLAS